MTYQTLFQTSYGVGLVVATEAGICSVELPPFEKEPGPYTGSSFTRTAAALLERYFNGEQVSFTHLPVDLRGMPAFRRQILAAAMQIPYGQVLSYGCLAQMTGYPGAARAVGGAMAANPVPVIIPCHRVVAASGALTGYSGPGGIMMKKNLLTLEGVEFMGKNRVAQINCFTQEPSIQG